MESKWSGMSEDAFFDPEAIDRNRVLLLPEYEYSLKRSTNQNYYIISADVGRRECDTVATVFRVIPQLQGPSIKQLVNIYTMTDAHFEDQAIWLKKLYYKYRARRLIIDANGLGIGLVDYMIKEQVNTDNGLQLAGFGVYNDDKGEYKKFETKATEKDALYLIKATAAINTEAHTQVRSALASGKLKLLIDEKTAKAKLLATKRGQSMTPEERHRFLRPFTLTSILKTEMLNLREENEGFNISLKRVNKNIQKDKFSALEYGLYYIKQEDESKRKKRFSAKDWMLMN